MSNSWYDTAIEIDNISSLDMPNQILIRGFKVIIIGYLRIFLSNS